MPSKTLWFALAAILSGAVIAYLLSQKGGDEIKPGLTEGATLRIYDIGEKIKGAGLPDFGQTPNVDSKVQDLSLDGADSFSGRSEFFIAEVNTWVSVEDGGEYEFAIEASGDCHLKMKSDHRDFLLDSPDGQKGTVKMKRGSQRLRLYLSHNDGIPKLNIKWRKSGKGEFESLNAFFTEEGVTRVISPGTKRVYGTKKPGHGAPLDAVHPGYTVKKIRPDSFKPLVGAMAILPDGRLAVATFIPPTNGDVLPIVKEANHQIYALEINEADPEKTEVKVLAEGLIEPCGMCVVGEDLYVSERYQITRLRDEDGDGIYETNDRMASGWESTNFHHFTFGLVHKEGYLYGALSTGIAMNQKAYKDLKTVSLSGPNPPHRGCLFRTPVDQVDNKDIEYLAGGLRTPNGLTLGPDGEIFVTDNQGPWVSTSQLIDVQAGKFYGYYNPVFTRENGEVVGTLAMHSELPVSPPIVYFPHNRVALSPTEPVLVPEGTFKGQVLVGDVTFGGIRRVYLDKVNGSYQGAVFRFSQGLECGVNRMRMADDGSLYIGGTGSVGNWSWNGKSFGLQKLEPNGKTVFEFESIQALAKGLRIRFTKAVSKDQLAFIDNYKVRHTRYYAGPSYGGKSFEFENLKVKSATASDDGREVDLEIEGMKAGFLISIVSGPTSEDGDQIWSSDAWYTMNQLPGIVPEAKKPYRPEDETEITPYITAGMNGWIATEGIQSWSYLLGTFRFNTLRETPAGRLFTRFSAEQGEFYLETRCNSGTLPWFELKLAGGENNGKSIVVHFGQKLPDFVDTEFRSIEAEWPKNFDDTKWKAVSLSIGDGKFSLSVDGSQLELVASADLEGILSAEDKVELGIGVGGDAEGGFAEFRRVGRP